jgi:hypothetical protein
VRYILERLRWETDGFLRHGIPAARYDRRMLSEDEILKRLRKICLALPDTTETITFGHPNFSGG